MATLLPKLEDVTDYIVPAPVTSFYSEAKAAEEVQCDDMNPFCKFLICGLEDVVD